jgi:5-methyltetrahydrofolate--homocysteine methyltransferase
MQHIDPVKCARHNRFWQPLTKGEGGYLGVSAPIDDDGHLSVMVPPPDDLEEQWLSSEYRVKTAEAAAQNIYWGQDAIQSVFVNFGPGVQAAMLGAPYKLQPNSIWFDLDPPIKNWDTIPVFKTDTCHPLYKAVDEHTRALCAASQGKYAVSVTDIGGQMDVLFSLRGEDLLTDLIEYPELVQTAEAQLCDEFLRYFFTLTDMIMPTGCGNTAWIPLISEEPWYPVQCDFSVMISPAMFEKFVLPSLDKATTAIGRAVYHLDGPGEIPHLDMILSLKHVHAIQWVPLPNPPTGQPGYVYQDFASPMAIDIYKRTLAAGKKLCLLMVDPSQIGTIYDAVGSDGIYIHTHCQTRKSADELINYARKRWLVL